METTTALTELGSFARAMAPETPHVEEALVALRRLLARANVEYVLVGGVAVLHHGYLRTTRDLDVLVEPAAFGRLAPHLAAHDFEQRSESRLRHRASGVDVDLLYAGDRRPQANTPPYPHPSELARSPRETDVVSLAGLVELKLFAHRYQDLADVVALLKGLDESEYLNLEASMPSQLRPRVHELRRDALDGR